MADRRAFLLRLDPTLLDALQHWANDDLRSLNGQIEFLLRRSLQQSRRAKGGESRTDGGPSDAPSGDSTREPRPGPVRPRPRR